MASDIRWNFTKFPVGENGIVRERLDSAVAPDAAELRKASDEALK
jgi:glutathione peroxidase-family protein